MQTEKFYGTFGCAHPLGKFSVLIIAESVVAARALMADMFGKRWCSVYPGERYEADAETFQTPIFTLKQRFEREGLGGEVRGVEDFDLLSAYQAEPVITMFGGLIDNVYIPGAVDANLRTSAPFLLVDWDHWKEGDEDALTALVDQMESVTALEKKHGLKTDFDPTIEQVKERMKHYGSR